MNEVRRVAGVNPKAIEQAALLDDVFFDILDEIYSADLIKKTSPIVILTHIKRLFPDTLIREWPEFDSGRTEDGEIDYTCNRPDWTKTVNGKRTVWVSYFDTIILRASRSMAILAQIENKKDIAKQEKKRFVQIEIEADIETLAKQLSMFKQVFRKAIALLQQEQRSIDLFPEMKLNYKVDSEGNIKQVIQPISIFPFELPGEVMNLTTTQFMSLDFNVVLTETEIEKKWAALVATMTREPKEEEEDEDNIQINNYKRFETGAASMLYLLEQGQFTTKLYSVWDKSKDIAPHADMIKTMVDLAVEFNAIAQHLKATKPGKGEASSLYARAMAIDTDVEETDAVASASTGNPDVPYSPEEYVSMNVGQYRTDYPGATYGLTDKRLFDLVMTTDDDMEPAEWRKYFTKNNPSARAAA